MQLSCGSRGAAILPVDVSRVFFDMASQLRMTQILYILVTDGSHAQPVIQQLKEATGEIRLSVEVSHRCASFFPTFSPQILRDFLQSPSHSLSETFTAFANFAALVIGVDSE
jgi:hypothetical protein